MQRGCLGFVGVILFAFSIFLNLIHDAEASDSEIKCSEVYSTWDRFEIDKLASIWLLKKFVRAPDGTEPSIKIVPAGTKEMPGIPFDVPGAVLRRFHNASTFETILQKYRIKDPCLLHIGRIVHDIEINIWDRKVFEETPSIQHRLSEIIESGEVNEEIVQKAMPVFDELYSRCGL